MATKFSRRKSPPGELRVIRVLQALATESMTILQLTRKLGVPYHSVWQTLSRLRAAGCPLTMEPRESPRPQGPKLEYWRLDRVELIAWLLPGSTGSV